MKKFNIYEHCVNKIISNADEKEKIVYEDNNCLISNYGRINFIGDFNRLRRKIKKFLDYKYTYYKDMILTTEYIRLRHLEIKELMLYTFYSDKFLLFLIENNFRDFNIALKEYDKFQSFDILSDKEKVSLLKPVYYRYSRKNNKELKNLQIEIRRKRKNKEEYKLPKNIVLYNVPYELIEYLNLKILGYIKIDLRDSLFKNTKTYILGNIKEFDRIEIEIIINNIVIPEEIYLNVKLYYKGIYIK